MHLELVTTPVSPPQESRFAKLLKNRTVRHSLQINALRFVSLAIGFGGSIWSSRCLGPEKLGISGMIIGTIAPLVLLVNLNQRAHYIRLYRGHPTEAEKDHFVTVVSTFRIAISVAVMLIAIPVLLLGHFGPEWYLALVAAFPYFFLSANAPDWLLQSQDNIPAITRSVTVQALIATTIYLLTFRPGVPAGSDLLVQNIALSIATAYAWWAAFHGRKLKLFQWSALGEIAPILREGGWLIANGVSIYVYTTLEVPLVGWLYSLSEVGIYRTSMVLVGGVGAFIGYLPILLYPRMLEWKQVGPHYLWQKQRRVLLGFSLFTVLLSIGAFLLAPLAYHYIYGPSFQGGAYPFAFLLTAKMMAVMNGIMDWGMLAQRRDRAVFSIMLLVAIFSVGTNMLVIPHLGALGASAVNMTSEMLLFTLFFFNNRRSLKDVPMTEAERAKMPAAP
jgi:O-antigen/teichoic acid export membrane protein